MSIGDINRRPKNVAAALYVHTHVCPECKRPYSCNCSEQDTKDKLVCRDCEMRG